jgi:hypothetical protein
VFSTLPMQPEFFLSCIRKQPKIPGSKTHRSQAGYGPTNASLPAYPYQIHSGTSTFASSSGLYKPAKYGEI